MIIVRNSLSSNPHKKIYAQQRLIFDENQLKFQDGDSVSCDKLTMRTLSSANVFVQKENHRPRGQHGECRNIGVFDRH